MPYASKAQVGYMHAKHPRIAARWDEKYGVPKDLPEKKRGTAVRGAVKRGRS